MNGIMKFDPFAEMNALQKQLFGEDWDSWFKPIKGLQLATTDVYTKENSLMVEAHLPNFDEKDVDVSVHNGVLEIKAERHEKDEDKGKQYVLRESSSSFYRRLHLPERAMPEKIEAHMEGGVLKVTVPMKELPQPKRIQIKAAKTKK